jgi:hypothetical protein
MSTCDKCKTNVPANNDAGVFDTILTANPFFMLMVSRHLLPVFDGEKMICSGSPSRGQYMEGQPRDQRRPYAYRPELELEYRHVYELVQQVADSEPLLSEASAS